MATLNLTNETQLGEHKRYDELGNFYTPIQAKSLAAVIENTSSRVLDAYKRWMKLFSKNSFPILHTKRPLMVWTELCKWILSSPEINDWIQESTGNHEANDIEFGTASGFTPKVPTHRRPVNSISNSWKVLNLKGLTYSTMPLSDDIRFSILTQRPNDSKLLDVAITIAYLAGQLQPWTKVELLAHMCYRVLESRPGLVPQLQGLYGEAEVALRSLNKTWKEKMLLKYLRSLLLANVVGETYFIFHLPEDHTFSAPIRDVLQNVRDLISLSECRLKVMIIQKATPKDSSFDWNVDLTTPQAAVAIQRDLERSLGVEMRAAGEIIDFKPRMKTVVSGHPRPFQGGWELWWNPSNFSPISLPAVRICLESGDFENAILNVLKLIPTIYQLYIKVGMLWLTFAARFLSAGELEDILRAHAVPHDATLTVQTFDTLLCGLISVDSRQVHHISPNFVDRLISMRESAILSETSPDTTWLTLPPDPDLEIAKFCVQYIATHLKEDIGSSGNSEESKVSDKDLCDSQNQPLLAYALEHWLTHAQRSRSEEAVVRELVNEFLSNQSRVYWWLQCLRRFADIEEPLPSQFPNPHYIAELLGITILQAANVAMHAAKTPASSKESAWLVIAIVLAQLDEKDALLKLVNLGELYGRSTLHRIFRLGTDDALCSLIPKVKNFVDQNANKIMENAVLAGNTKLVGALQENFSKSIKYDQFCPPLLHTICHSSATGVSLRSIFNNTRDLNSVPRYNGSNPIHWAALSGNHGFMLSFLDLIEDEQRSFLLDEGDADSSTPLLLAAQRGHFTVASHLIHAGADTSKQNDEGRTPLHEASARGYIDIVDCILRRSVSLWDTDKGGNLALHLAIRNGYPDIALTLVRQAREESSPLTLDERGGSAEMVRDISQSSGKSREVVSSDQRDELVSAADSACEQSPLDTPTIASKSIPPLPDHSAGEDRDKSTESNPPGENRDKFTESNPLPPDSQKIVSLVKIDPVVTGPLGNLESDSTSNFGDEIGEDTGQSALDYGPLNARRGETETETSQNVTEQSATLLENGNSSSKILAVTSLEKSKFNSQTSEGTTALNLAAYWNYPTIVKALLKKKANINIQTLGNMGRNALHHACDFGYEEVGEMLIDELDRRNELSTLNCIDNIGNTALHLAAGMGCVKLVRRLLEKNAQNDTENYYHRTALDVACVYDKAVVAAILLPHYSPPLIDKAFMSAAIYGKHELVEKMLRAGANPDTQDKHQNSALHLTAWGIYPRAMASILKRQPTLDVLDSSGGTPLHDAAKRNSLDSLRMLVEAGSDMAIENADGFTPLYCAAESPGCVRTLLEAGSPLKVPALYAATYSTFADLAASNFSCDAFQVVIQHLHDKSQRSNDKAPLVSQPSLRDLIDSKDISKMKKLEVLLQYDLDPDLGPDHVSLLHYAVTQENIKAVEMLSRSDTSKLNKTDAEGNTFLALAASKGTEASFQIVKLLVLAGADPKLGSKTLGPPLHAVAILAGRSLSDDKKTCYLKTAAYLLEKDHSLVDVEGGYCGTALHAATQSGSEEMVELILLHQPKLTKLTEKFGTALHAAVDALRLDIIMCLLQATHAFKPEIRNAGGCFPVHYAAMYNHWNPPDALSCYSLPDILDPKNTLLLQRDYQGRHALHFAAANCAVNVAKKILEEWPSCVHDVDCDGWSALHWAARGKGDRATIVKLLLKKNANKSLRSHRGWKPIHTLQYHTRKQDKWDDVEQLLGLKSDSAEGPFSTASNFSKLPDDEEEVLPVPQAETREVKDSYHCDGCFCVSGNIPAV
ncbi:hypothetical protein ACMFMF_011688 [Clarireedia jacksonii]